MAREDVSSIEDIVRLHARERSDALAVKYDDDAVTFGELDRRSNMIANGLISAGVGYGQRVAVVDRNRSSFFELLFGIRKAGAIPVPINWRLAPDEVGFILADAEVTFVFARDELAHHVGEAVPHTRMIMLGGGAATGPYAKWRDAQAHADPGRSSASDAVALQLYTSGTTGRPKGAMLGNRGILSFVRSAGEIFGSRADARHLNTLPLFHVGGINWALQALAQGASCIGFRDFDADAMIQAIGDERITHMMTVPAVIQLLLASPRIGMGRFDTLRAIVYGGSTIAEKVLREAVETFGCGFYGMYGSTELSFGVTLLAPEEHDFAARPDLLTSCGRPLPGTTVRIVDPATLRDVPDGEPGEIWVDTPQRAEGYWRLPEATAQTFRSDGWYRSGDIGFTEGGHLHLCDRMNDMIVSGGENVYPAEVERVLLAHEAVADACVFATPDDKWGEGVTAAIILKEGHAARDAELIAYARDRLAGFKCPRRVEFVEAFPRTASGKVQRHVLKAPFWMGYSRRIN